MGSSLDETIRAARAGGFHHAVAGPEVTRLQRAFIDEARLVGSTSAPGRLSKHALLVESAKLVGDSGRVAFVLQDARDDRRVAVDVVPEGVEDRLMSRERSHAILSGGDVNAVILFRGKDALYNLQDCVAVLARLEHTFFSERGFDQALIEANPLTRNVELSRRGVMFVPVPWGEDDVGELRWKRMKVVRRVRKFARRMAA